MTHRIAFFLPHFGHGGAEGVVLRLLQGIDRERFSPCLILQRRRGELLERVPDDVPVFALSKPRPPHCLGELADLYRREKIDLAVSLNNAANLYSLIAAGRSRAGNPTLVTEHTPVRAFLDEAKLPRLRRFAIRRLYPRATLTGGPIDGIGEDLRSLLGSSAPPFVTLPNPVVDRVGALNPVPDLALRLVSVGRLAPEKRFDLMIDAFARMVAQVPDARLTIYGEGSERAALEEQARRLGLPGRVTLPGYVTDLDQVHGGADLFLVTSRREGLGNAMIEAMARGVPVVSVDCPFGPKLLLGQSGAGRLVETDTPDDFAAAVLSTLSDRALRESYVAAGLDVARAYEVGRAVRAYEDAFDRALVTRDQ